MSESYRDRVLRILGAFSSENDLLGNFRIAYETRVQNPRANEFGGLWSEVGLRRALRRVLSECEDYSRTMLVPQVTVDSAAFKAIVDAARSLPDLDFAAHERLLIHVRMDPRSDSDVRSALRNGFMYYIEHVQVTE